MQYEEAKDMFSTARNKDAGKPLPGQATRLHKSGDNYAVRYHKTDVVTIHPDGTYTLSLGGWNTLTTRRKMTDWSPAAVFSHKGIAHVFWNNDEGDFKAPFEDTIKVDRYGQPINPPNMDDYKALAKCADKMIRDYAKGFVEHVTSKGKLQKPDGGDCWFCLMFDSDGVSSSIDHIISHMSEEERYYVPSLLFNALVHRSGGREEAAAFQYRLAMADVERERDCEYWIKSPIARYLKSRREEIIEHLRRSREEA